MPRGFRVDGSPARAGIDPARSPSPDEGWMGGSLCEELSDSSWRQWVVD